MTEQWHCVRCGMSDGLCLQKDGWVCDWCVEEALTLDAIVGSIPNLGEEGHCRVCDAAFVNFTKDYTDRGYCSLTCLDKVRPVLDWVSIAEELPTDSGPYLCLTSLNRIYEYWYAADANDWGGKITVPVAWLKNPQDLADSARAALGIANG